MNRTQARESGEADSPGFPADHVERLRGHRLTGLKIREQDTRYQAGRLFRELAYPAAHPYRIPALNLLASALTEMGQRDAGREAAERALAIGEDAFGGKHPDLAPARRILEAV